MSDSSKAKVIGSSGIRKNNVLLRKPLTDPRNFARTIPFVSPIRVPVPVTAVTAVTAAANRATVVPNRAAAAFTGGGGAFTGGGGAAAPAPGSGSAANNYGLGLGADVMAGLGGGRRGAIDGFEEDEEPRLSAIPVAGPVPSLSDYEGSDVEGNSDGNEALREARTRAGVAGLGALADGLSPYEENAANAEVAGLLAPTGGGAAAAAAAPVATASGNTNAKTNERKNRTSRKQKRKQARKTRKTRHRRSKN